MGSVVGLLNVLAALISNGDLFSTKFWKTATAEIFSDFLCGLKEHIGKPLAIILDNASIHKAKSEKRYMTI